MYSNGGSDLDRVNVYNNGECGFDEIWRRLNASMASRAEIGYI
jgi:hypothetical protein